MKRSYTQKCHDGYRALGLVRLAAWTTPEKKAKFMAEDNVTKRKLKELQEKENENLHS